MRNKNTITTIIRAGRSRIAENSDLPPFLYSELRNGITRYRLTLIDGSKRMIPSNYTREEAISVANTYNFRNRSNQDLLSLINESSDINKSHPFSYWLPKIIEHFEESELCEATLSTHKNDLDRLDAALGHIPTGKLKYGDVVNFLNKAYGKKSKEVYNKKLMVIKKVFAVLADESAIETNFMLKKLSKTITEGDKKRKRHDLSKENYNKIFDLAPNFLKVSMILALQTTHTVSEIYRIEHTISQPSPGRCGIVWYESPKVGDNDILIFGQLYIHRNKTKDSGASFIAIPVTSAIKEAVDLSDADPTNCPYIVKRKPLRKNKRPKECNHEYQVSKRMISEEFSKIRDKLGLYSDLKTSLRPTFNQIRPLAAKLAKESKGNPQIMLGHTDEKTTYIYLGEEYIVWNQAPAVIITTD